MTHFDGDIEDLERIYGVVTAIKADKKFGFIHGDNGEELFFHHSAVVGGEFRNMKPGDKVRFIPTEGPKGPRAVGVKLVTPVGNEG